MSMSWSRRLRGPVASACRHIGDLDKTSLAGIGIYVAVYFMVAAIGPVSQAAGMGGFLDVRLLPDPVQLYFAHLLSMAVFILFLGLSLRWKPAIAVYGLAILAASANLLAGIGSLNVSRLFCVAVIVAWALPGLLFVIFGFLPSRLTLPPVPHALLAAAIQLGAFTGQLSIELAVQGPVFGESSDACIVHTDERPSPTVLKDRQRYRSDFLRHLPSIPDVVCKERRILKSRRASQSAVYPLAQTVARFAAPPDIAAAFRSSYMPQAKHVQHGCDTTAFVAHIRRGNPSDSARSWVMQLPPDYTVMVLYAATPEDELADYTKWQMAYHCCLAVSDITNEVVVWAMYP